MFLSVPSPFPVLPLHKVNTGDPPLTLLGLNPTLEHPCHGL